MPYVLKTIGIIILVLGIVFFLKPLLIRNVIDFMKIGKRCYLAGVVRIIIGALILATITHASIKWIPAFFGAVILISGIAVFLLGLTRIHAMLDKFYTMADNKLRYLSITTIAIGTLLIYSA